MELLEVTAGSCLQNVSEDVREVKEAGQEVVITLMEDMGAAQLHSQLSGLVEDAALESDGVDLVATLLDRGHQLRPHGWLCRACCDQDQNPRTGSDSQCLEGQSEATVQTGSLLI